MLSRIAAISGLLAASWFGSSVNAERLAPARRVPPADKYVWTVTWTGPKTCPSWPCSFSYIVVAPAYNATSNSIPPFEAECGGTVDLPLQPCYSTQGWVKIEGNFSTFETSGVGSGLIDIHARWGDRDSHLPRELVGITPMQASSANNNTWTVHPEEL
ncbi:hypothetical protein F4777DRAFT_102933 [Nemania sp. FL0916]|nr:hypothetical protein F4777DRAFT_102933 [Nemania sp. FL0916]